MPRQSVNLYPLHDDELPSSYTSDHRYLVHKPGDTFVSLVQGYWRSDAAITLRGVETIDRLIEALQDARKQMQP